MTGPTVHWLPDKRRLHMNHGPIDLVVEAFGPEDEVRQAYTQAAARFHGVLDELVSELPALRSPVDRRARRFRHATAQRMEAVCARHHPAFVTPMAAVAGGVADEVLAAMIEDRRLQRAYVNNGGDVALHLAEGAEMTVAIAETGLGFSDRLTIRATDPVRGLATSGWRGRSHSLGIADTVTVLAGSAAEADVAATLIANAVDLPGHCAIGRLPAKELSPDSDLNEQMVTVAVAPLSKEEALMALEAGLAMAQSMRGRGMIEGAALFLQGQVRLAGGSRSCLGEAPQQRSIPVNEML